MREFITQILSHHCPTLHQSGSEWLFLLQRIMKLQISKIRIDGGTQPRKHTNEEIVSEYASAISEGENFPPVVVFNDGTEYWLADGFHRYHATKKVGYLEIEADVKQGTRRDAILYSVGANSNHGLRRSNEDKRKAVLTLLEDEEWSQWSNEEISRKCAVSAPTVSKYRDSISKNFRDEPTKRKVKRGDQEYTVDTSNIGKSETSSHDFFENGGMFKKEVPDRKGIGLEKAHEAISKLKQIPPNDGLLQDAYDTVIQWINYNR